MAQLLMKDLLDKQKQQEEEKQDQQDGDQEEQDQDDQQQEKEEKEEGEQQQQDGEQQQQDQQESRKVTVCHKTGTSAENSLTVARAALIAHLNHGDLLGPCVAAPGGNGQGSKDGGSGGTVGAEQKIWDTAGGFTANLDDADEFG